MNIIKSKQTGFTLIEIAIVLVIVGFLLAGMLASLSSQIELRKITETKNELSNIKNALMGFTMSHNATDAKPYLPCPDTDANGTENRVAGLCSSLEGDLPWADLGVQSNDSWDRKYRYRVTQAFANSNIGIRLITPAMFGDINVLDASAGNTIASNVPVVIYSRGKNGATAGADETENSSANAIFVSHEVKEVAGNEFDDLVEWIPTSILFHEMVSAGKLP